MNKKTTILLTIILSTFAILTIADFYIADQVDPVKSREQVFQVEYRVQPSGMSAKDVLYIPLPQNDKYQIITKQELPFGGKTILINENNFLKIKGPVNEPVVISYNIHRKLRIDKRPMRTERRNHTKSELAALKPYLTANSLSEAKGACLQKHFKKVKIEMSDTEPAFNKAFLIYMKTYRVVGPGPAHPDRDAESICEKGAGNSHEAHTVFMALASMLNLPVRYNSGLLILQSEDEKLSSQTGGWVEFHDPEKGWFPVDVFTAHRDHFHRKMFFGSLPADRIKLTSGRDLELPGANKSITLIDGPVLVKEDGSVLAIAAEVKIKSEVQSAVALSEEDIQAIETENE